MIRRLVVGFSTAIGLVAFVALSGVPGLAQTSGEQVRLTGAAFDQNTGRSGNIIIDVTRWSTNAETSRLLKILMHEGQDAVLDALKEQPVTGSVRAPGQLAYDLRYARRTPLPDGGSRIVLATDRYMSFWEVSHQPRSVTYPFTWIEIRLNRDGEGEGKMSIATKATVEDNTIVLENYQLQPVLLKSLKEEPLKAS